MMFDPKKEVPSLELCKQLKELGFPQDGGGWYWIKLITWEKPQLVYSGCAEFEKLANLPEKEYFIKAPTFIELWKYLPKKIKTPKGKYANLIIKKISNVLQIEYDTYTWDYPNCYIKSIYPSELDSICKMCIWLREKGYIKFNKEAKDA